MTQAHLYQQGILDDVPAVAAHIFADIKKPEEWPQLAAELSQIVDGRCIVMGTGAALHDALGVSIPGMMAFPGYGGHRYAAGRDYHLWFWIRAEDQGVLHHHILRLLGQIGERIEIRDQYNAFRYRDSRDLSGYEDGTENPQDEEAVDAAIATGAIAGSSFATVQPWLHNLAQFMKKPQAEKDDTIGRRLESNEEFDEAPESAHVKRTAQESFEPEAFIVRRSMPWTDIQNRAGLVFLAFGNTPEKYETIFRRMLGQEDGVEDALFNLSTPIYGSNFWCPPVTDTGIDLRALI